MRCSGAGVAEVMAYLNGCHMPKLFNIKTLVVKFVSCACAVGAGLPVGPEGPMIHIGALVCATLPCQTTGLTSRRAHEAALQFIVDAHVCSCGVISHVHLGNLQVGSALSQGHSTTLNFTTGMFTRFQNPRDQRDFVTAGVTCS
jgi:chloride channel 7